MNLNSQEFIQKLKLRDNEAIKALFDHYHEALYKAALKQKLAEDQAQEVVQATWLTLFEKIESFEQRSHIRTFIFGILYNKIKELWRSNKKYTQDYSDEQIEQEFDKTEHFIHRPIAPDKWSESNQFIQILEEELEKLPPNQRIAFVLKEIEGEETENICNILQVSNTNLGVLIFRAKNTLRKRLEIRFKD